MTMTGSVSPFRGRWRVRLTVDGKRRSLGVYDTREEAEEVLEGARRLTGVGASKRAPDSLAQYGEEWLRRREADGLHQHVKKERSRWARHIATAPFIHRPIKSLTHRDLAEWVRLLSHTEGQDIITTGRGTERRTVRRGTGKALARQTVVHALNLLRACLDEAVNDGICQSNAAARVKAPRRARDADAKDAWTFLTADELAALASVKMPEGWRATYTIAAYTGLRKGELCGLRWQDVVLEGAQPLVRVRRSYGKPAKSAHAVREVPLLPPALAAFRTLREQRPGVGAALVWPARHGGCHGDTYEFNWKRWGLRVAKRKVRFHDLRHTCASHLVMGTWGRAFRLDETKAWMGHSSIMVTQRYSHLAPDSLHAAARQASDALNNALNTDTRSGHARDTTRDDR